MNNLELYDSVRSVPENAKKTITGGRLNGKTDINPMWRIKTLTEKFGACGIGWYYNVIRQWTEQGTNNEIAAFVNIELFIRVDGEWSKPIFGNGGSMFVVSENKGLRMSDECFKMATTDAISVACKQLGIGADVYWSEDKTKYDNQSNDTKKEEEKLNNSSQNTEEATEAQKKAIYAICKKHNINVNDLYALNGITQDTLTKGEATNLIKSLKAKFGDE